MQQHEQQDQQPELASSESGQQGVAINLDDFHKESKDEQVAESGGSTSVGSVTCSTSSGSETAQLELSSLNITNDEEAQEGEEQTRNEQQDRRRSDDDDDDNDQRKGTQDEVREETEANERQEFTISWHELSYVVESKWYKLTSQRKPILNKMSGSFRSGELSAVLGPSGAGKSTLIDCLLGKRESRNLSGRTQVTFSDSSHEQVRRTQRPLKIATIPQADHLLDTLTVAETFMFASRIKNAHLSQQEERESVKSNDDQSASLEKRSQKTKTTRAKPFDHFANVQRVIQQLNLSSCASTRCGKLSGGQYKRVSIGQELLSRPDLMILDEPTSGLDSVTCQQTVSALRYLIDSSPYPMAIVATIHQPDYEVFQLFHKAYVIAEGGRAIYEGPIDSIYSTVRRGLELVEWRHSKRPKFNKENPSLVALTKVTEKSENTDQFHELADIYKNHSQEDSLTVLRKRLDLAQTGYANPARLIVELAAGKFGFEIEGAMNEIQSRAHELLPENGSGSVGGRSSSSRYEEFQLEEVKLGAPTFDYEANEPSLRRVQLDRLLKMGAANRDQLGTWRVWLRHLLLHTHRSWLTILRDPMLFTVQLALHIFVPLLISYAFQNQVNTDACPRVGPLDVVYETYREGNVLDDLNQELRISLENLGYLFFQLYVIIFAAVCVTSLTYPLAMHVLLKEHRNGWYSMSSYFLGRTIADLPVPTVNVILAMAISYHLTGQPVDTYDWRFWSIAWLTVLATLVAQTMGLFFGAMLLNAPQSAVFVAPASTAPLVVVCGFLLRIKSLPQVLQVLSQFSYFTHLINGVIVSRYGFNRCACKPEDFLIDEQHEVPKQTRAIIDLWIETFAPEYANGTDSTGLPYHIPERVDLVGKLTSTISRAKTYNFDIETCDQVKPFVMLDYQLNDSDLLICFLALISMLIALRWFVYMVLSWRIKSRI